MTEAAMAMMEYLREVGLAPARDILMEAMQRLTQKAMELDAAASIVASSMRSRLRRNAVVCPPALRPGP